jgi:hypothetical protein
MKRYLLFVSVAALLSACGEHAEPGSSLAARFMVAEFVGKSYHVDLVHVDEEPVVVGDTAKVTAVFQGGACRLELAKKLDANQYGWLAKTISGCRQSARRALWPNSNT